MVEPLDDAVQVAAQEGAPAHPGVPRIDRRPTVTTGSPCEPVGEDVVEGRTPGPGGTVGQIRFGDVRNSKEPVGAGVSRRPSQPYQRVPAAVSRPKR